MERIAGAVGCLSDKQLAELPDRMAQDAHLDSSLQGGGDGQSHWWRFCRSQMCIVQVTNGCKNLRDYEHPSVGQRQADVGGSMHCIYRVHSYQQRSMREQGRPAVTSPAEAVSLPRQCAVSERHVDPASQRE